MRYVKGFQRFFNESQDSSDSQFDKILFDFISMAEKGDFFLEVDDFVKKQKFEYGKKSMSSTPYGEPKLVKIRYNPPYVLTIALGGIDKNFVHLRTTNSMKSKLEKDYPDMDITFGGNLTSRDYELGTGYVIEIRP